jgi:hypothetical protein
VNRPTGPVTKLVPGLLRRATQSSSLTGAMRELPSRREESDSASSALKTPLPIAACSETETRFVHAWREWLSRLATDAEAALAAAMAYRQLDDPARDTWLSALEHDAGRVNVPRIAVYAPLLAVECDGARRARIAAALGPDEAAAMPRACTSALRGIAPSGQRVTVLSMPLYLEFVQVVACGYRPAQGFEWVRHDPILHRARMPRSGDEIQGVILEDAPPKLVIDELAHAVVAHTRAGHELPEALRVLADIFAPSADAMNVALASGT